MIVTSVQIKTAKTQKHLYCLVFTLLRLWPHKRCKAGMLCGVVFISNKKEKCTYISKH